MLKNLLPPVLVISIPAIFSNEHMLSLSALHRIEAKTKAIFAFHMLGVSCDNIANSPNSRVNSKEKSISPEIITAMLTKISYVAIRDAKASEKRHSISQKKANVGNNMQKGFFPTRLSASSRFDN
jgi:abortive infection bacteriophage resistance protein